MDSKFKTNYSKMEPYPNCPSLAYIIASRVTGKRTLDCCCLLTGSKGNGKSLASVELAYQISRSLARKLHKKELKQYTGMELNKRIDELALNYFNIDTNLKSCDKNGSFEMFSSETLTKGHQVLIADDFSISASSKDAMTKTNKMLGKILTVARIYKAVVILNTVYASQIDRVVRSFVDIIIEVKGVDEIRNRTMSRVYLYSISPSNGKEYKKFLRYKGMRITNFFSGLPPTHLKKKYEAIRVQKTGEMIEQMREDKLELDNKGNKTEQKFNSMINKHSSNVMKMVNEGMSVRAISRENNISGYWVEKIIAANKQ